MRTKIDWGVYANIVGARPFILLDMERTYKCIHCGKEFSAKKSNARFCSKSCCTLWHRHKERTKATKLNIQQGLQDVFSQIDSQKVLTLGNATDDLLQTGILEKFEKIIDAIWIPNNVGTGGMIDLSVLGGKGMIKIEFVK